jgi:hypothetical protein
MMLVWIPSLILLAHLLWREGVGRRTDRGDRLRHLFLSLGLEFEDQPPIPKPNSQIQLTAENTPTVAFLRYLHKSREPTRARCAGKTDAAAAKFAVNCNQGVLNAVGSLFDRHRENCS